MSTVSAYVIGIIVCLALLLVSALVANLIAYQPGLNPTDPRTRKIWFWVLGILVPIVAFAVMYFFQYNNLKVPSQKSAYMTAMSISCAISFVVYVLLGFVMSKIFKNGKIGNWF